MKSFVLLLLVALLFLCNCDPQKLNPKPKAAFSADKTVINQGETVHFTDESLNNPTIWVWDFGDGSDFSYEQNPSHTYSESGVFNVAIGIANDDGDDDYLTKNSYITVNEQLTDVTFNNPTFTDITITLNGDTKTISSGGNVTYYAVPGSSATFSANTYGKTTEGTQVGIKLYWDDVIELNGGSVNDNLNVGSDYFFVYIRNNGTHVLTPIYVNYGLSSQTIDNILIPADNVKYRLGYYEALSNSNVRGYYQDNPTNYSYWNQGTHFTLPWANNQSVELLNNYKSAFESGQPPVTISNAEFLIPAGQNVTSKNMNQIRAKDLYCK